jgi:hypothetical protein
MGYNARPLRGGSGIASIARKSVLGLTTNPG